MKLKAISSFLLKKAENDLKLYTLFWFSFVLFHLSLTMSIYSLLTLLVYRTIGYMIAAQVALCNMLLLRSGYFKVPAHMSEVLFTVALTYGILKDLDGSTLGTSTSFVRYLYFYI